MRFLHKTSSWSLRSQLRTLLVLSGILLILLSLLGGWRLQQLKQKNTTLLQTSRKLGKDLEKNFVHARLLTEIQSDLDTYMRSAPPGILHKIHSRAETLRLGLSPELKSQLAAFIKKLDILEIRMNSFRQNNDAIFSIDNDIVQQTDNLLASVPLEFHKTIRQLTSRACLKHHHLYKNILLSDEQIDFGMTAREYEQLFLNTENKIKALKKILPSKYDDKLKKYQDAFYDLDESILTIIAIRRITLETKDVVNSTLASLRSAVAESSLSQAKTLTTLTQSGLDFLKNNLLAISGIMITMAALGAVTALFLMQTMVKPLIAFTNMLKKMASMLSGLRNENEFEEDFSIIVNLKSFGQIQNDLSTLIKLENDDDVYPWAVKLDDLEIFLLTLISRKKKPIDFVNYLLMRETLHEKLICSDELEICGGFIEGKLKQKKVDYADVIKTHPRMGELFDYQYNKGMGFKNEKYLNEKQSGKYLFW